MNSELSISSLCGASWKALKSNIFSLVGIYVAFLVVVQMLGMLVSSLGVVGSVIQIVLSLVLAAAFGLGYARNCKQALEGDEPTFSVYSEYVPLWIVYIVVSLITGIVVSLGIILFIIPGMYLYLRLQFYPYIIMNERIDGMKAIGRSWKLTNGHVLDLLLIFFVQLGAVLLGLLCLLIGVFVAIPFGNLLTASAYFRLVDMYENNYISE